MAMNEAMNETQTEELHDEAVDPQPIELIELVRDHPWMAVLGAAALGFVVARLVRGDR